MLIFWSLVRNSVVLAVYLLFSVACFLTVHEHLRKHYHWQRPLRSLGVKVTDLTAGHQAVQLDLFTDERLRQKWEQLDKTVDWLRGRFGNNCIQRAVVLQDKAIAEIDAKADHIIHPVGFF